MTWKRCAIALVFSGVLIAGAFLFANQSEDIEKVRFEQARKQLQAKRASGELSPEWRGVDLDKLDRADVGIKLSAWDEGRISAGRFLTQRWPLWVPLVIAACLGIEWFEAWLFGRRK
jgi:hypothetical protein